MVFLDGKDLVVLDAASRQALRDVLAPDTGCVGAALRTVLEGLGRTVRDEAGEHHRHADRDGRLPGVAGPRW